MRKLIVKYPGAPHFGFFVIFACLITIGIIIFENTMSARINTLWELTSFILPFLLLFGFGIYLWDKQKKLTWKLYILSITDSVSGAFNHLYLYEKLDELIESGDYICIVFIDLDAFKKFNDLQGHLAGDKALKLLVQFAEELLGKSDFIARSGGDEFVIVIKGGLEKAKIIAQKTLARFEESVGLTACYGIASLKPRDNSESMVQRADTEMYKQKAAK